MQQDFSVKDMQFENAVASNFGFLVTLHSF